VVGGNHSISESFGAIQVIQELHLILVGDVVAAQSIDQDLIVGLAAAPCQPKLAPQVLQAVLQWVRPCFIDPLDELALLK
jgi:hypothetical protein